MNIARALWRRVNASVLANHTLFAILTLAISVIVAATLLVDRPVIRLVHPFSVATKHVTLPITNPRGSATTFRVVALNSKNASYIARTVSRMTLFGQYFNSVTVAWDLSANTLERNVRQQRYDLLVAKPEDMADVDPKAHQYHRIAYYDPYTAFFISAKEPPQLTRAYLHNKKLGLLTNPNSRSGFIIPVTVLQDAGVPLSDMKILLYKRHYDLRHALASGEVDLIGSYWGEEDQAVYSHYHALEIGSKLPGLGWYVTKQIFDKQALRCAIGQVLAGFTTSEKDNYFGHLNLMQGICNGSELSP